MELHIALDGRRHLTRQIYQQLRTAMVEGRLEAGDRLPPTRELAQQLGVSRSTIMQVYDLLMSEGLLSGTLGAGTFVSEELPKSLTSSYQNSSDTAIQINPFWRSLSTITPPVARTDRLCDFTIGLPDKSHFPFAQWRSIYASRVRVLADAPVGYGSPQGLLELRQAIAKYIVYSRAVHCQPENIIITNGAQQAFNLIGKVLLSLGDVVAMEEPGYTPARQILESYGATVVGVPVDEEGIRVESLPKLTKLIYVTPSHQFPLGVPLSLSRRWALLEWATRYGAAIIEDDYDSEFRFEGRSLESLQNLDRTGRVLYVGTFSKVLFPEIRLGFMVVPAGVTPALIAAKQLSDVHSPLSQQATLAKFIEDGHLAKHIRKLHKIYDQRRQCLLEGIQKNLSDWLQPIQAIAGLHIAAWLTSNLPTNVLVRQADQGGVAIQSLEPFYSSPPVRSGLAFGYGLLQVENIDSGLAKLRKILIESENNRDINHNH